MRHFSFSIFITLETHVFRVVQKRPKYRQTWKVMSQDKSPNLPKVDRSGSDTAAKVLRNSARDAQCHHGRNSQGKVDGPNLERKLGQLKMTHVSASAKRDNFNQER